MKKVLITGAGGFVGKHLINHLSSGDYHLFAGVHHQQSAKITSTNSVYLDLNDSNLVNQVIGEINPDWVFHLAALSSPKLSFKDNHLTLLNNVMSQANLLDALVKYAPKARTLIIGSAEEYGKVNIKDLPISELCPLKPLNPYAVSKITQDYMGLQYYLSFGLPTVRVRPFNHTGPGQSSDFVLSAFAKQVALIEAGLQPPTVIVGNLNTSRDFTDVKDVVNAYELALLYGQPGEVYNIGSGKEIVIHDLLDLLLKQSCRQITIRTDTKQSPLSDVPRLQANNSKFSQLTNWKPKIPLIDTICSVLDYWRSQVKLSR